MLLPFPILLHTASRHIEQWTIDSTSIGLWSSAYGRGCGNESLSNAAFSSATSHISRGSISYHPFLHPPLLQSDLVLTASLRYSRAGFAESFLCFRFCCLQLIDDPACKAVL